MTTATPNAHKRRFGIRAVIDNLTVRTYSTVQAIGWLLLGNLADWNHHPWWFYVASACIIMAAATFLNAFIRTLAGLAPHSNRRSQA